MISITYRDISPSNIRKASHPLVPIKASHPILLLWASHPLLHLEASHPIVPIDAYHPILLLGSSHPLLITSRGISHSDQLSPFSWLSLLYPWLSLICPWLPLVYPWLSLFFPLPVPVFFLVAFPVLSLVDIGFIFHC